MRAPALALVGWLLGACAALAAPDFAAPLRVEGGRLASPTPDASGVRVFRGVPYAAAPVGDRRWRPPAPVTPWRGVRPVDRFGANCMQRQVFGDIHPQDPGVSEDCLFLNVWTPAARPSARLPVMVWIHGGGFMAGSGAEARHDGVALARQGVVVVTLNYRLGVFGLMASPELTAENGGRGSGDQGLLDQLAALGWVKRNIAAFGGDPQKVTIFGESAGSWSVSALTASPLARGLFRGAIGESGALVAPTLHRMAPLKAAEAEGAAFEQSLGARDLAALRRMPAQAILDARFEAHPFIDGVALPEEPDSLLAEGRGNPVPVIFGSNSREGAFGVFEHVGFEALLAKLGGTEAPALRASLPADPERAKDALGGDLVIAYPTWAWAQALRRASGVRTWSYLFDRAIGTPEGVRGEARHADDIVFAFDHPERREGKTANAIDARVAAQMSGYFVNFAKTLDPNGPGLPPWPAYAPEHGQDARMVFGDAAHAEPDPTLARYRLLQRLIPGAAPPSP